MQDISIPDDLVIATHVESERNLTVKDTRGGDDHYYTDAFVSL